MNQYLQAAVTILSLVNPMICAAIFSGLTAGRPFGAKVSSATSAILRHEKIGAGAVSVVGFAVATFHIGFCLAPKARFHRSLGQSMATPQE